MLLQVFVKIANILILTSMVLSLGCTSDKSKNKMSEINKGQIQLTLGHDMPKKSLRHLALTRFAEILKFKTQNKIIVNIIPNQKLGTDYQMIEKSKSGQIDLIFPPTAKLSPLIPILQVFDIPYFFSSKENLYQSLESHWDDIFKKELKKHGLIGLHIYEGGFKQIISHKKITKINDFSNIKFRVMKSNILMQQYSLLQSKPIHIDFHQLSKAFNDKNIDAFENPIETIVSMNLVNKKAHILMTNHAFLGQYLIISEKSLAKIPTEMRRHLFDASEEAMIYLRKLNKQSELDKLKQLETYGVNIRRPGAKLTNDLKNSWNKLTLNFRKKYSEVISNIESQKSGKSDELYIGLDLALTGPALYSGKAIELGTKMAIEEINEAGGIKGLTLKAFPLDNQGFPSKGIANVEKLSANKNLVAIMGGLHSPIALKQLSLIHKKKIPFLIPWAAATHIIDNGFRPNYVFRFSVRDEYAGKFLINQAQKKYKKIALLLENTGWGKSNEKGLTQAMKAYNLSPSTVQFFNWGEKSLNKQILEIKKAKSEVIIFVGNAPEGTVLLKSLIEINLDIPIISHWGITGGDFYTQNKNELEKVNLSFLQTYILQNQSNNKVNNFIKNIKKTSFLFKEKIQAPVGIIHAYELTHILAKALIKSKSFAGNDVRLALKNIKEHKGIFRDYNNIFAKKHEALGIQDFSLAKYNNEGHIVEVNK